MNRIRGRRAVISVCCCLIQGDEAGIARGHLRVRGLLAIHSSMRSFGSTNAGQEEGAGAGTNGDGARSRCVGPPAPDGIGGSPPGGGDGVASDAVDGGVSYGYIPGWKRQQRRSGRSFRLGLASGRGLELPHRRRAVSARLVEAVRSHARVQIPECCPALQPLPLRHAGSVRERPGYPRWHHQGSQAIWREYGRLMYANWASGFFADALVLERSLDERCCLLYTSDAADE